MKCPRCEQENPPQAKFCLECGAPIQRAGGSAASGPRDTDLRRELLEARDQQRAASEILQVIASSPTDIQFVFDTIVRNAARLCDGFDANLVLVDGDEFVQRAHHGPIGVAVPDTRYPLLGTVSGRAILEARVIQVENLAEANEYSLGRDLARQIGYRTTLIVPLLRRGVAIGAIGLRRTEVQPFTDRQIALLKTFADQAVIAIENVRLFNETKESLERQTATSEILRVISSSPTDVQPVFEAITDSAMRLFSAWAAAVFRYEGQLISMAAARGGLPGSADAVMAHLQAPHAPTEERPEDRTALTRTIQHVVDVDNDMSWGPRYREDARARGFRSYVAVPMLRGAVVVGVITVSRQQVGGFAPGEISLLQTFADQAVIAIENVRLFTDLQEKNGALTEALDQQTATSEILRVIASSPTDVQPVFDTILASATILLDGFVSSLTRRVDDDVHMAAFTSMGESLDATVRQSYPVSIDSPNPHSVAIRRCEPHIIADADSQPNIPEPIRRMARARGWRSNLVVPLRRGGMAIGALGVSRRDARGFTPDEIALLQTFADQAVIAIENVRLFNETKEALEQQTATSEILGVIASSPTELDPVFESIVRSAARVCDATDATLAVAEGHEYRISAHYGPIPLRPVGSRFLIGTGTVMGKTILQGRVFHVEDLSSAEDFPEGQRLALELGQRATLCVPLLREGASIGTIMLRRTEAQLFTERQVTLLKTFADQAVIAIENVRLFTELQEKNRALTEALEQQTATSEVLKVISRSTFDLQPVLQTLIENATRLCSAQQGFIFRADGDVFQLAVDYNAPPAFREWARRQVIRPGDGSLVGRVALENRAIHILDAQADAAWRTRNAEAPGTGNVRTLLGLPMRREGALTGVIAMWRTEIQPFTEKQLQLIETFADQATIAIENSRLLSELRERTAELTRSVDELKALADVSRALSSTLELDAVLQTIVTRANQLAGTDACSVFEYDEATEAFHLRATNNLDEEVVALARQTPTRKGEGVQGRMAVTRQPVQVPDISKEDAYHGPLRDILVRTGTRAVLAVPMLRENELIGGLTVNKRAPGEFSPEVIELLTTFATQSALAIQNARLFREIEQKSRELEAASRHKSEFLANMSHELRTPLNAVIGFSEVLSERMFGELNEKQDEYLKDIHASGQHLLSLINDILDLSKIEAGRMELEVTEFNLPMTIDNALTLVRERAAHRSIALHTSVDERLGQIQGDERKIRQVLLNLLSNAIKFTPEGGRIEVGAKPVNGSIEVSVSDTGVGIAPEDQEAVFEEFRQVGTAEKKVEGTGLGLALSRKFIELHGGKIWVKSQVGAGSTLTFSVPVRRGE
jgi:GAF domain-containing protein/anti-sigma regulatory factor (Ser/Thr protein kinase)